MKTMYKNLLTLIALILTPTLGITQFNHLANAPTAETCSCLQTKAYKYNLEKETTVEGSATIYRNLITFKFKSTSKRFILMSNDIWIDEGTDKAARLVLVDDKYFLKMKDYAFVFEKKN